MGGDAGGSLSSTGAARLQTRLPRSACLRRNHRHAQFSSNGVAERDRLTVTHPGARLRVGRDVIRCGPRGDLVEDLSDTLVELTKGLLGLD